MVLVKNKQLFHSFIFGKMGNENVFHNTLERKPPLKTVKTVTGKSRKTGIFLSIVLVKNWQFSMFLF